MSAAALLDCVWLSLGCSFTQVSKPPKLHFGNDNNWTFSVESSRRLQTFTPTNILGETSTEKTDMDMKTWVFWSWIDSTLRRWRHGHGATDTWRSDLTTSTFDGGQVYQSTSSWVREYGLCLLLRRHGNYRTYSSSQTDIWLAECHYELPKHLKKKARIMSMCRRL